MVTTPVSNYRYERKYQTDLTSSEVANLLLLNSLLFKPIYYRRLINSLYFDTPELEYFHQNQSGDSRRKKVRVRWYGQELHPTSFQIEVKSREGELIRKDTAHFGASGNWSTDAMTAVVRETLANVMPEANTLIPTLQNSYWRSYFSSQSGMRVTVDDGLVFEDQMLATTIVECKYPTASDALLRELVQHLPLRISKSSKYVMGMQLLLYVD